MALPPPALERPTGVSRWWGPIWRVVLVITLGLLAFVIVWGEAIGSLEAVGGSLDDLNGPIILDLVLGALAMALYPLRHRRPLLIVGIIVALSALSSLASAAAVFGIISLATRRRRGEIGIIAGVLVASILVNVKLFPFPGSPPWWGLLLIAGALAAVLILIGLYIGGGRQLLEVQQNQAEQIQREHSLRLEAARMTERTHVAREMHDALAHRLSLVTLHAGALEYRTDLPPEQIKSTAGIVRENARLAANDLREVLEVLRAPQGTDIAERVRPPGSILEGIEVLMQDSRDVGNPATLAIENTVGDDIDRLPTTIGHTLYRIIQEGLTNARKHAPGESIVVNISGIRGHRLSASLTNPVPTTTAPITTPNTDPTDIGFGLTGLRERVRLAGGSLTTRERDGSFTLEAWLPLTT